MALSKKDYAAIAKVIDSLSIILVHDTLVSKTHLVMCLAEYFEKDNPNFKGDKFIEACWSTKHRLVGNA